MVAIATYHGERFTLTDMGEYVILRSKLASNAALAFSNWDIVKDAISVMLQGLPPNVRHKLLVNSFSVRELGLAFDELAGNLHNNTALTERMF